jgi:preprotein translocase subunit SecB
MTPSPLQLESSHLLGTEVKAAEKIPATPAEQTIKTRLRIGRSPGNELEWNVILGVTFGRSGKTINAPYHGDVVVEMRFLLHPGYPAEKRDTLMQVTGASLAYGMIRETVANLTARGPYGTHLLPSVSFLERKNQLRKTPPPVAEH